MTAPLLLGAASFLLSALSDVFGVLCPRRGAKLCFALGGGLLALSTLWLALLQGFSALSGPLWGVRWLMLLVSLSALGLLVYTLFFALPRGGSGMAPPPGDKLPLVDTGVYALCRHPGVLWLGLFYLALWAALGGPALGAAALLFPALDALYVLWQDRAVFPRSIRRYEEYRARVPFLLPSVRSLRACARTLTKENVPPPRGERGGPHDL